MRFMMLMIPGVYQGAQGQKAGADFAPGVDDVQEMMKFNEGLAKSGNLILLDGLHPPSMGARVSFKGGKPMVVDGPFAESKEVLGGFWIINAKSKEEAVEWAKRVPAREDDVIEVRQIFEMEEFPEEVQKKADSKLVKHALKKGKS
jgi:hypothetical protein